MLNENALRAFLVLAETGSFQQAARSMGVSNASVSRYISQAEDHTGGALFHRSRNSSTLTRAGRAFLPIALELRQALDRYGQQVTSLRDTGPGKLLIGCGPLATRSLVLPVLNRMREALPELRYEILVSAHAHPLNLLHARRFDLFIGDLTYTPPAENVEIMVMAKQDIAFYAHKDHDVHTRGAITLAQMFSYPFASPHLHKHWKSALVQALGGDQPARDKVETLPQIESDDFGFLTGLLARPDIIVGGMPDSFADLVATGRVRPIELTGTLAWNICAARSRDNSSGPLDLFWRELTRFSA